MGAYWGFQFKGNQTRNHDILDPRLLLSSNRDLNRCCLVESKHNHRRLQHKPTLDLPKGSKHADFFAFSPSESPITLLTYLGSISRISTVTTNDDS